MSSSRKRPTRLIGVSLMGLLLIGTMVSCGSETPTATPTSPPPAPPEATATPTAESAPAEAAPVDTPVPTPTADPWIAEWDALVAAAQEEGKLHSIQGGSQGRDFAVLMDHFGELFDIEVVVTTGQARGIADRVIAERANGLFEVDIWQTGGIPTGSFGRVATADSFIPVRDWFVEPYASNPDNWLNGELVLGDVDFEDILCYASNVRLAEWVINTDIVDPAELQTVDDLLKWDDGQIVMTTDPRFGAEGISTITPLFVSDAGREWYERLWNEAKPTLTTDVGQGLDGLIRGTYAIADIGGAGDTQLQEALQLGFPIAEHEVEGFPTWRVGGGGCFAVFKNAVNPNAAKLFGNWLLSEEGWNARVDTINQIPESVGGSTYNSIPLIKGYSVEHIEPRLRLAEGESWYSVQTDPKAEAIAADALAWATEVITNAGY